MIVEVYNFLFYQPVFKILNFAFNVSGNVGFAIFFLTFLLRLFLFPLNVKVLKEQQKIQDFFTEIKKRDSKKDSEKIMQLFKEKKINPLLSYFLILIQIPILVAIFQVLKTTSFPSYFFGPFDLSKPNIFFPLLFLIFGTLSMPKEFLKNPLFSYFFLFLSALLLSKLPGAISFFVVLSYFFSILEKFIILKKVQ